MAGIAISNFNSISGIVELAEDRNVLACMLTFELYHTKVTGTFKGEQLKIKHL